MNGVPKSDKEESVNEKDLVEGIRSAIAITKSYMEDQEKSMTLLRDIAKTLLATGSGLMAIISGLRIFVGNIDSRFLFMYYSLFGILAMVYVGFVVFCILAMKPEPWHLPFPQNYDKFIDNLCVPELKREEMLLSAFLKTLEKNKPIIKRRNTYLLFSAGMLGAVVLIIFGIAFIPTL